MQNFTKGYDDHLASSLLCQLGEKEIVSRKFENKIEIVGENLR